MGDALLQKTYTIDFLNKKRGKNNGTLPQYYIEDDHEAIIPKDIFMRVQEEMARRSSERDLNGRRQGFSANHAFSHMVTCECCGEHFRRLHWNNRGKKTIVWRCKTRLEDKTRCMARTVSEDELQQGFIDALNEMIENSDGYLSHLKTAINLCNPQSAEAIAVRMNQLQQELIDRTMMTLWKKYFYCVNSRSRLIWTKLPKLSTGTVYRRFATSLIPSRAPSQSLMGRW